LTIIKGQVGAGKSSLLLTILGEMNIFDGTLKRSGRMAYLEQEPWIVSGTIKENITLGFPFNEVRYNETVNACGLRDDIDRM
jgi:ABC-type transport system involved in cytochrome bd biosynthesis fused ATPase/permease subunit